jgi:hypothetical protein
MTPLDFRDRKEAPPDLPDERQHRRSGLLYLPVVFGWLYRGDRHCGTRFDGEWRNDEHAGVRANLFGAQYALLRL